MDKVIGHVELRSVSFIYPSRPEVTVLSNFSLDVASGTSFALCGQSGSGKSTVVQAGPSTTHKNAQFIASLLKYKWLFRGY